MTEYPPPPPSGLPVPGMVTPPDAGTSTKNNWQGVVAAITGLLGMGLLGVIFGALGLQSVRARTATNRGLALTGIIAGSFWTLAAIVIAVGVAAFSWGSPAGTEFTPSEDVVVGDCIARHGDIEDEGDEVLISGVYTMDCATPHYGEVYYIGTITASAYPGWDETAALTEEGCFSEAAARAVDLEKAGDLGVYYLFPTSDSWDNGDRLYDCIIISETEDLVGSVLLTP